MINILNSKVQYSSCKCSFFLDFSLALGFVSFFLFFVLLPVLVGVLGPGAAVHHQPGPGHLPQDVGKILLLRRKIMVIKVRNSKRTFSLKCANFFFKQVVLGKPRKKVPFFSGQSNKAFSTPPAPPPPGLVDERTFFRL